MRRVVKKKKEIDAAELTRNEPLGFLKNKPLHINTKESLSLV